jgi:hypothetical protein
MIRQDSHGEVRPRFRVTETFGGTADEEVRAWNATLRARGCPCRVARTFVATRPA